MRRRILPRILAVGILVLTLAGCVRFQADLTLTPENTVDGRIVVAVLMSEDTTEARASALTAAAQIEAGLLGTLRSAAGVTVRDYEEDDYLGTSIEFAGVPLDAFSGEEPESLAFSRDGDGYVFSGVLDFGDEAEANDADAADEPDGNLRVSVTFPGEVTSHNGDLAGTTVTWTTTLEQRVEMSARGLATPSGPPVLFLVLMIGGGILLAAAVIVVVLLLVRRSRAATPPSTPTQPSPPAPPAAAPEVL